MLKLPDKYCCFIGVPEKGHFIRNSPKHASDQEWGYVNVREDAYMFWWLYYSMVEPYSSAPLVLWLQVRKRLKIKKKNTKRLGNSGNFTKTKYDTENHTDKPE